MISADLFEIRFDSSNISHWNFVVKSSNQSTAIGLPQLEIDGQTVSIILSSIREVKTTQLKNGSFEHILEGQPVDSSDISLRLYFQIAQASPVVRFRYMLRASDQHRLSKAEGSDNIEYARINLSPFNRTTEIRLSEFSELLHSFVLNEVPVGEEMFQAQMNVMGPILTATNNNQSLLIAYEHGSMAPDAFVQFNLKSNREVAVRGVKGNYLDEQILGPGAGYESLWLQFAAVDGDETSLARAYRDFVLHHFTQNAESRKPYIFYNTWNYQERLQGWHGKKYLEEMNETRMLKEIEVAAQMGIEVFVIDTGWFQKTGDWQVSRERFPSGMKPLKDKLDQHGMKLGLWFDNAAALSSNALANHKDCVMSWKGKTDEPHGIWETEAAQRMCLVSRYWQAFADELIRLVKEVGVTYFKWDAIGQYGCDDPNHEHGNASNSRGDRADAYAFRQPAYLTKIIDRLCAACPEAIVDFDITEGNRCVGLSFLSAGKFFLINNGPYYRSYKLPQPTDRNSNLMFYPGQARNWFCRPGLAYDKWIPSVLFLTHYLPDDPAEYQIDAIASLILGQNGIWGDLPAISKEGVARFAEILAAYKKVRADMTEASPVVTGRIGGSPEIHEKINSKTGGGAIVIFTNHGREIRYVSHAPAGKISWTSAGIIFHEQPDR